MLRYLLFLLTLGSIEGNDRYEALQPFLDHYQRAFTTLNICSGDGDESFRIARDYPASVNVMIEENNHLLENCKAQSDLSNIILLKCFLSPRKVQHLSECEHFDLVLALNALHKYGRNWKQAADAIIKTGDHIIFEITDEEREMREYILAKGGEILATLPNCALYKIESIGHQLKRKTWFREVSSWTFCTIASSFTEKTLTKPADEGQKITLNWIPGINLCTFKMCYGAYPTTEQLKESLHALKSVHHNDWMINNMILQGKNIAFIDFDSYRAVYFSEELLGLHLRIVEIQEPEKVEKYFWNAIYSYFKKKNAEKYLK